MANIDNPKISQIKPSQGARNQAIELIQAFDQLDITNHTIFCLRIAVIFWVVISNRVPIESSFTSNYRNLPNDFPLLVTSTLYFIATLIFWGLRERPKSSHLTTSARNIFTKKTRRIVVASLVADILYISIIYVFASGNADIFLLFFVPLLGAMAFLNAHETNRIGIIFACAFFIASILHRSFANGLIGTPQQIINNVKEQPWLGPCFPQALALLISFFAIPSLLQRDRTIRQRRTAVLDLIAKIAACDTKNHVFESLLAGLEKIGFDRGRIWCFREGDPKTLISIRCTPNHQFAAEFHNGKKALDKTDVTGIRCLEENKTIRYRYVKHWYHSLTFASDWINILPSADKFREVFEKERITEWLEMPIFSGATKLGKLSVDNAIHRSLILSHDREQFDNIAAIVSATLCRIEAQERLSIRERQYNDILEHLPIAIFLKNEGGVFQFVNRMCVKFFGLAKGEIEGKSDLDIFPLQFAKKFQQDDKLTISSRQIFKDDSEKFPLRTGAMINVRVVKVPLFEPSVFEPNEGTLAPIGVLGFFEPQAEGVTLAAMNEALKAESNTRMFRWFTHDSPELLKAIKSILPRIEIETSNQKCDSEKVKALIKKIDCFTHALFCGYHAYGYFGRKGKYKWDVEVEPVTIGTIIDDVLIVCRLNNDDKQIHANIQPKSLSAKIDSYKFSFMVMQLVNNAIKAIDYAKNEHGNIIVSVQMESEQLTTIVTDNGCGCNPMSQAEIGTSGYSTWDGNGLGLEIVQKFALMANGKVTWEWPAGGGAKFKLEIPII